jgi:hypothetical protein
LRFIGFVVTIVVSLSVLTTVVDTDSAKKAFTDETGDYDFVINLAAVVCWIYNTSSNTLRPNEENQQR